jgi:hypothetical protein
MNKISKRTLLLIAALLGVTAILLYVALAPKKEKLEPKVALQLATAKSSLSFTQPKQETGSTYSTNVDLTSGGNKVTGVQLELEFNPAHISDVDVKPGPFFENSVELIKNIDDEKGTISYAIAVGQGENGVSGSGTVAIITFTQVGEDGTESQIKFLPKTLITSDETDQSVLKSGVDLIFKLGEPTDNN